MERASKILSMETEMENKSRKPEAVPMGNVLTEPTTAPSAHAVGRDPWGQVGLLLVVSYSCGYILSYPNLILVPLGWGYGIACMFIVALYIAYSNWLFAGFHFIGGQRFIRCRDIMGFLFGKEMYYITWGLQSLALIIGNLGFILLGGRSLKAINTLLSDSPPLRLQYFIMITGLAYLIFSVAVPTMSAMGRWLAFCTFLTFTYIILLVVYVSRDGIRKSDGDRNYNITGSSEFDIVCKAFGAITAIIVCNNAGLQIEIQSTLKKPAVLNMRKAICMQFTMGVLCYYSITILAYWAFGSGISDYLPNEISAPKWVKIVINAAAFLQAILSQHMFVAPIHETLDTHFLEIDEKIHSRENLKRLICVRTVFFAVSTFVVVAVPFMGDIVNFYGSICLIPLTFIFPSLIHIKVKGKTSKTINKLWHWFNIVLFSLLVVVTTAATVRSLVKNINKYHFFADT